jgi:O-antigen biosynthesis protein
VIVVDNAPATDATAALLRRHAAAMPYLRYARTPWANTAMARNRGIALAQGDIVCCIDDDAVADSRWLSALAAAFEAGPNVACVTGLILPLELETPAQLWFEQFGGFGKGFARRVYDLGANRPDDYLFPYAAGTFGSGPNMAFRRDVLQAIGGFDPALGGGTPAQGGEDLALYFEVLVRGYQLVYEPAALVRHAHRREYPALRRQIRGYGLGLAAYLTRSLVAHPQLLPDFCRRLPAGLRYAGDPGSGKNRKKTTSYPTELTRIELRGMLIGPVAYLLGCRQPAALEHRRQSGSGPARASALAAGAGQVRSA